MNTLKFLNSFSIQQDTFAADMSAIRSKFFNNGICWTDDVQGQFNPATPFRVVLYTKKGSIDFKNPMVGECNGTVFEYNNGWNLLALPQGAFCTNKISMKKLNDMYSTGGYEVYEVLDATILTLYFYNDRWCMSSTRGYDIGHTEMVAGMTFIDAFQDLMNTKYKAFRFELLNKSYSYTIALRHSKYHIFDETKHLASRTRYVPKEGVDMNSYIMIMCVADTQTGTYVAKNVAGLPHQNPASFRESTIQSLVNYARSAYSKYAKAHRLQNFKYKPLYGYILRSKHRSIPSDYSTIYLESELYKAIKQGIYKDNKALMNCNYNQLVVSMTTNHERYEQFRIMFQQFEPIFQQLDTNIDSLTTEVTRRIIESNENEMDVSGDSSNPLTCLMDELVNRFKNESDITSGIIKDALYSKTYSHYLPMLLEY